ncbi:MULTISPECIES: DUF3226 domain-containing protein [unclassified Rhizobium]|uniref:DUF3226 domain-containing protein n=1 Tax=unclassified Rhizobium TaxID=2613769 RepID=UPI00288ACEF1|nr:MULTISPECIES: DUF3226 domain-containing protein [unclassified Rhizobium]
MSNAAIIVEGGHDASFLGQILKTRGFKAVNSLDAVPEAWTIMFPRRYPVDGNSLDRVIRFPEVYIRDEVVVGIVTAGSDSRLVSTLRNTIDAIGISNLNLVALFVDIDSNTPDNRFSELKNALSAMNTAAIEEKAPGYPITLPQSPGTIEEGAPKSGIYMFPDNLRNGSLETVLLECAKVHHADIAQASIEFIDNINASAERGRKDLKLLRSGMGMLKAKTSIVANILKPATSLAASLAQSTWLHGEALNQPFAARTIEFVDVILENLSPLATKN